MNRLMITTTLALVLGGSALAADFGGSRPSTFSAPGGSCGYRGQSVLAATYSTVPELMWEVRQRYEHALQVSEHPATAYSNSERYTWSYQARGACGRAIGYLSTGEINHERLWDCECYYNRMGGGGIVTRG